MKDAKLLEDVVGENKVVAVAIAEAAGYAAQDRMDLAREADDQFDALRPILRDFGYELDPRRVRVVCTSDGKGGITLSYIWRCRAKSLYRILGALEVMSWPLTGSASVRVAIDGTWWVAYYKDGDIYLRPEVGA